MIISCFYVTSLLGDDQPQTEEDYTNTTISSNNDDESVSSSVPNVIGLTVMFFTMYMFSASQDVVVDGWALTMLKPQNVGYAPSCNSIGSQMGWIFGYIVFTSLGITSFF